MTYKLDCAIASIGFSYNLKGGGEPRLRTTLIVHGHKKNELPFEEKIRARVKDERIVKGFMELIEKNKKIVWDAENNVMEKMMVEKMQLKTSAVKRIMENIKKDEVLRAIYKNRLL